MKYTASLLGITLLASSTAAGAAQVIDGVAPMLCVATSTVVCSQYEDCVQGPAEKVNLPLFWRVDPARKTVESTRTGGEQRRSELGVVNVRESNVILQGEDNGFPWSVSISKETGKMVVSGGRDDGYLVFGACTAL